MTTGQAAKDYVKQLDLEGTPRALVAMAAATESTEIFEQTKQQAQVVGSGLLAFSQGVEAEIREAISDSALLAQLVANKRIDPAVDPVAWFKEYVAVLQNVGWTIQDATWTDYTATGTGADVSDQIIKLLPVLLGPGAAAAAIVTAAVAALKGMDPDGSWITIFNRETQKAKLARFQVGLVESDSVKGTQVSLLACLVEGTSAITQILFFKFKDEKASFKASTNSVTINTAALKELARPIRSKVRAYQVDYLSSIKDI